MKSFSIWITFFTFLSKILLIKCSFNILLQVFSIWDYFLLWSLWPLIFVNVGKIAVNNLTKKYSNIMRKNIQITHQFNNVAPCPNTWILNDILHVCRGKQVYWTQMKFNDWCINIWDWKPPRFLRQRFSASIISAH